MLRGLLQCKTKPWEGWPVCFPASAARSTPKAVESFGRKLDCNLIDGLEDVLRSLSCPGKPTIVLYSATELCLDDTTHMCVRACVPSPFLTGPTVSRSVSPLPGGPQWPPSHHMLSWRILHPAASQLCLWPLIPLQSPNLQPGDALSSDLAIVA